MFDGFLFHVTSKQTTQGEHLTCFLMSGQGAYSSRCFGIPHVPGSLSSALQRKTPIQGQLPKRLLQPSCTLDARSLMTPKALIPGTCNLSFKHFDPSDVKPRAACIRPEVRASKVSNSDPPREPRQESAGSGFTHLCLEKRLLELPCLSSSLEACRRWEQMYAGCHVYRPVGNFDADS